MPAILLKVLALLPWGKILEMILDKFSNTDKVKDSLEKAQEKIQDRNDWMDIARREIGQKEIRGRSHNPRIIQYHKSTSLRASTDEVPWCSSFVNWVVTRAGYKGTNSAAARSWLKWGHRISGPKPGCIVVFWRGKKDGWSGHVGFVTDVDLSRDKIRVLGGNQADMVKESWYSTDKVLGYRWPESGREAVTMSSSNYDKMMEGL